jgi:hypothetical protein
MYVALIPEEVKMANYSMGIDLAYLRPEPGRVRVREQKLRKFLLYPKF